VPVKNVDKDTDAMFKMRTLRIDQGPSIVVARHRMDLNIMCGLSSTILVVRITFVYLI